MYPNTVCQQDCYHPGDCDGSCTHAPPVAQASGCATARNAFMNALRILYNIEPTWMQPADRERFLENPVDFLIRADDPTVDKVWALIQVRQPERYRG